MESKEIKERWKNKYTNKQAKRVSKIKTGRDNVQINSKLSQH
jgi:hypothetical protein